jgi:hypothetical protein
VRYTIDYATTSSPPPTSTTAATPNEAGRCNTKIDGVTLGGVPTSRPRHVITETDQVARAIDDAARRWPEEGGNRPRLLLRLLEEGHRAVTGERQRHVQAHRDAVASTSGALTGLYGEGYLDEIRAERRE